MESGYIKYVANYLRKSRGDIESSLDKHRTILSDMCVERGWTYVEYEEIETGDSISMRPVMQRLIADIKNGLYDAVCVVDIDRLGRGDMGDQDTIKKAFAESSTLIVTPQHTYNLENENDEFSVDVRGLIARQEYRQIVKRLLQGKRVGARQGMWTNGSPPFPYEYQAYGDKFLKKGIVVNDEKLPIYRYIIDSIVHDEKSPATISQELNNMNTPSPRGKGWHGATIYRMAIDLTHLGWIVSNKTVGNAHKRKKERAKEYKVLPKEDWVIVKNCHEPIKTLIEHEQIVVFFSRLNGVSRRKPNEILPLTGLVKCGLCGRTMTITIRSDRAGKENVKACWYKSQSGEKCPNRGGDPMYIYDAILSQIADQKSDLQNELESANIDKQIEIIQNKIKIAKDDLEKKKSSLDRILEAFEAGLYTVEQAKVRKERAEKALASAKELIDVLTLELKYRDKETVGNKIEAMERFLHQIKREDLLGVDKNRLYKSVIDSVVWTRRGENIEIVVNAK